jgi:hypothetical protein
LGHQSIQLCAGGGTHRHRAHPLTVVGDGRGQKTPITVGEVWGDTAPRPLSARSGQAATVYS